MTGDLQTLRELADRVKDYVERNTKLNESSTKAALIDPLLQWLGWRTTDPEEVRREWRHNAKAEPVDYALIVDGKMSLLIEAKSIHDPMRSDKGWRQMAANGLAAGFKWCARMNGRQIVVVNLHGEGTMDRKVFWRLDLATIGQPGETSLEQAAKDLTLISKQSLTSGATDAAWEANQAQIKAQAAIEHLLAKPSAALINMVRKVAGDPGLAKNVVAMCFAEYLGKEAPAVVPPIRTPEISEKEVEPDSTWGYQGPLLMDGKAIIIGKYRPLLKRSEPLRVSVSHIRHTAETVHAIAQSGDAITIKAIRSHPIGPASYSPTQRALGALCLAEAIRFSDAHRAAHFEIAGDLSPKQMVELVLTAAQPATPSKRSAPDKKASTPQGHLEGKPQVEAIYNALLERMGDTVKPLSVHANARHIVLSNKHAFAAIGVQKAGLRIGLRLETSEAKQHPRLKVQPKGIFEGWSALHVSALLSATDEIDEELLSLIKRAHEAAG